MRPNRDGAWFILIERTLIEVNTLHGIDHIRSSETQKAARFAVRDHTSAIRHQNEMIDTQRMLLSHARQNALKNVSRCRAGTAPVIATSIGIYCFNSRFFLIYHQFFDRFYRYYSDDNGITLT